MFVKKFEKDEWQVYRVLRLEALAFHEDVYGGSFKDESAWSDAQWEEMFAEEKFAFFGLYDESSLIGIACVFADRSDKAGKSALLAGAYIKEEYRGQGLSRLLYEARIGWIVHCGHYDRITVGHKQGNEASRRANQRFGFQHVGKEDTSWGDGSQGIKHSYELRIA